MNSDSHLSPELNSSPLFNSRALVVHGGILSIHGTFSVVAMTVGSPLPITTTTRTDAEVRAVEILQHDEQSDKMNILHCRGPAATVEQVHRGM